MKRIFALAIIFLMTLTVCVSAQEKTDTTNGRQTLDPKAAEFYTKGAELKEAQNLDGALVYFDSSLAIQKDYRTYFQKAQIFQTKKNYSEAIANYKLASENSTDAKIKDQAAARIELIIEEQAVNAYNTGYQLAQEKKFDEALVEFDKSIAIKDDYKTQYQKGFAYINLKNNVEAKKSLFKAIALNDKFEGSYNLLAYVYTAEKNYDSAAINYNKILAITENEELKKSTSESLVKLYYAMANENVKAKKYDKAIELINQAIAVQPSDQLYLALAKAQIEKKQYDEALASLDKATELKSQLTDGAIAYYKGTIYKSQGNSAKALEQFKIAATDPNYKKYADSEIKYFEATKKGAKK